MGKVPRKGSEVKSWLLMVPAAVLVPACRYNISVQYAGQELRLDLSRCSSARHRHKPLGDRRSIVKKQVVAGRKWGIRVLKRGPDVCTEGSVWKGPCPVPRQLEKTYDPARQRDRPYHPICAGTASAPEQVTIAESSRTAAVLRVSHDGSLSVTPDLDRALGKA